MTKIQGLAGISPSECTFSLGIRNTTGAGDYQIYDQNTEQWLDIDNISLSFDVGVKMKTGKDLTDAEEEVIKEQIVAYINNFVNSTTMSSFSIENVFDAVEQTITNIEYMILYKINMYNASKVQAIRKRDGEVSVKDVMCVKMTVGSTITDLQERNIVTFQPDIFIREIT